ncbi:hypothetical protein D3C81_743690 [compost metagenome]
MIECLCLSPISQIAQQSLSPCTLPGQQQIDPPDVLLKVLIKQSLAKLILGAEVVIERAFGHASRSEDFGQADSRVALMGHKRSGDINDVLTHVVEGFLHNAPHAIKKSINRLVPRDAVVCSNFHMGAC